MELFAASPPGGHHPNAPDISECSNPTRCAAAGPHACACSATGETYDWCTPNEVAPEWEWMDVLYKAPQFLPAEEIDPTGGINAFYRCVAFPGRSGLTGMGIQ